MRARRCTTTRVPVHWPRRHADHGKVSSSYYGWPHVNSSDAAASCQRTHEWRRRSGSTMPRSAPSRTNAQTRLRCPRMPACQPSQRRKSACTLQSITATRSLYVPQSSPLALAPRPHFCWSWVRPCHLSRSASCGGCRCGRRRHRSRLAARRAHSLWRLETQTHYAPRAGRGVAELQDARGTRRLGGSGHSLAGVWHGPHGPALFRTWHKALLVRHSDSDAMPWINCHRRWKGAGGCAARSRAFALTLRTMLSGVDYACERYSTFGDRWPDAVPDLAGCCHGSAVSRQRHSSCRRIFLHLGGNRASRDQLRHLRTADKMVARKVSEAHWSEQARRT
jgi:hypothetical protein